MLVEAYNGFDALASQAHQSKRNYESHLERRANLSGRFRDLHEVAHRQVAISVEIPLRSDPITSYPRNLDESSIVRSFKGVVIDLS